MRPAVRQRRDEAVLGLAGGGLLEGFSAGAAMGGPLVMLLMGLIAFALNPTLDWGGGDVAVAVTSVVPIAIVAAPVGVVGGALALVVLGVVAHWKGDTWTYRPQHSLRGASDEPLLAGRRDGRDVSDSAERASLPDSEASAAQQGAEHGQRPRSCSPAPRARRRIRAGAVLTAVAVSAGCVAPGV